MSFNLYGLLVGLAVVVALLLVEKKSKQIDFEFRHYYSNISIFLFSSLFFARLWHVVTDWHLYQDNLIGIFKIWNGGISILGAVLGGVIAFYLIAKFENYQFKKLLDLIVFGLPFAQSIGRWGNYFNKELYGLATDLPWGITIDNSKHHPLFLYESLLTFSFGIYAWKNFKNKDIGKGKFFMLYVAFYSLIRFLLDFLRVEKRMINGWLGINQLILVFILLFSLSYLMKDEEKIE
ncbi:MAG: prolipoprotein diacylglyceryl transferase [Candidatus Pacebacteria bacterium]|nr:prolipoprotein diacylglyceryl transferase [Candidatus Paceibacterota bacterium]